MAHTNYRDMPAQIRNFESFTHGSCHAINNGREYIVVSYSTPIARAVRNDDGVWDFYLNARKYSQTTSKLQNIVRRAWPVEEVDGDKALYPERKFY